MSCSPHHICLCKEDLLIETHEYLKKMVDGFERMIKKNTKMRNQIYSEFPVGLPEVKAFLSRKDVQRIF